MTKYGDEIPVSTQLSIDSHADFLPENKLLLNAVGEGIYGFDLKGNAVFINPAAERMTG